MKYAKDKEKLIDLCCGKGGDMHKWISSNIKVVIGYDISKEYIEEAKKRCSKFNKSNTNIIYRNIDLRRRLIETEKEKANIITCNFALHYFFKNKDTLDTFMKSITSNLRNNGYFIGTIFDGKSVLTKLNNNKYYSYKDFFKIDNVDIDDKLLGNKIEVYLKNSIINNISKEYLIPFGLFVVEMEKYGFVLIDSKMFEDFEKDYKYELKDYEKDFSFLNRYFVFKYLKKKDNIIYN